MTINWQNLCILWSVLSLDLLSCAADTYDSPLTRRKNIFKLGTPKSKPIKLSTTGVRKLSQLSSQRPYSPPQPTPRSMRAGKPKAKIQSEFASLPDVSVTCSISDFLVRVKPAFYGLGADAEELKLGSSCKSNGVLIPYGDLLFTYPLTACDAVREDPHGYLVYKFVLHYEPSQKRFPSRAHRVDVNIECRYQRNHHVYQLAVKPTWETAVLRKRLKARPSDFQMDVMDDSWSEPAKSQVYQLGKTVNFQVSASHLPTGGKLYISSCYAAPSSGTKSSLNYTIIDNFGCMLDSKSDPGASQFISQTDRTVRFSLKAFQFTADPDTEISIHCKVSVISEDPGPAHKSCTYRGNGWKALTGDDSICECCDSLCVTSKSRRAVIEGSASSGSFLVSDSLYTEDLSMGKDETIINHYTDEMHSPENLWKSTDVVKDDDDDDDDGDSEEEQGFTEEELEDEEGGRVTLGVMTQPGLDKLGFRDGVLVEEWKASEVSANEFVEDRSGKGEDFLDGEEEEERSQEREDEFSDAEQMIHLNQKNNEVLKASLQSELLPPDSKDEENSNCTVRDEEDEKTRASEVEWKNDNDHLVDDSEMTWYFTWK